ncbi:MAG: phosphoglycerate mutase [uncultured bacterium]|nr:MAG: phosphoglycerate mutase [uncultured bacterium]
MALNLPEHLLTVVNSLTPDTSAVLLLRHAERKAITPGDDGVETDLTPFGYAQSFALGQRLKGRLKWAHYSPLLRAQKTAEQFMLGAETTGLPLSESNLLGSPGPFVIDRKAGQRLFATLGTECLVRKLAAGECFEGIRSAQEGAQLFVEHLSKLLSSQKGLGVMISHDAILIPLLAVWMNECFQNKWLEPLDGALFIANNSTQLSIYRNGEATELLTC